MEVKNLIQYLLKKDRRFYMLNTKLIEWYSDNYIGVFFNIKPDTHILYPEPNMTKEVKKDISKKPFLCKNEVKVILFDYFSEKRYDLTIEAGYRWDGASIPQFAWRIIGSKEDPRFLIPSLVHDKLCENKGYVDYDRYFADKVFERLLYVSDVPAIKRWAMFHSLDNFQKLQGWEKKEEYKG